MPDWFVEIWGIKSCTSCTKPLKLLQTWNGVGVELHDTRKKLPEAAQLREWATFVGSLEGLKNTRGTALKKLSATALEALEKVPDDWLSLFTSNYMFLARPILVVRRGGHDGEIIKVLLRWNQHVESALKSLTSTA